VGLLGGKVNEVTEAQKRFNEKPTHTFEVGQYSDMGMWFVRRKTTEVVALASDRYKALQIQNAFETAYVK
jgi:hypothetical protein